MLPRVVLHNAISADGRIDSFVPDIELYYSLVSEWGEDATLVGSNTVLASDEEWPPEQEAEAYELAPGDHRPLLVIPDSKGRIRVWHALRGGQYWRDGVAFCSNSTPSEYLEYLRERNIDYIVAGDDHVDLRTALEELNHRYGVKVVRVDSGGALNGVLLKARLVSEVSLLVHPCLVGGTSPSSIFRASDLTSVDGAIKLELKHMEERRGGIVWLRYDVR